MTDYRSPIVKIDAARIVDWGSFHGVFAEALGFPDFHFLHTAGQSRIVARDT